MTLGYEIRELRRHNKMRIQDIAEKTGYSKALISRIENDSVIPSIASVRNIASVLDITLHELFAAAEKDRISVVKKKDRKAKEIKGNSIQVESLCENITGNKMMAVMMTFPPGAAVKEEAKEGIEEKWWHVLGGKLEIVADGKKYELAAGDSIYAHSTETCEYRNPTSRNTSALVIVTPSS
jgi:transcriptional regulator with XRE-family HTH domain